jgi:hypothetical protein
LHQILDEQEVQLEEEGEEVAGPKPTTFLDALKGLESIRNYLTKCKTGKSTSY